MSTIIIAIALSTNHVLFSIHTTLIHFIVCLNGYVCIDPRKAASSMSSLFPILTHLIHFIVFLYGCMYIRA